MKTYAFIFARGGSKGVPRKNIRKIQGLPLIVHSIKIAKKIEMIDKIYVSTEDSEISAIAYKYGACVIPRPENLAQDNTSEWKAWSHAINWLESKGDFCDIFISLPATSPLRSEEDISKCLASIDNGTDIVVGITESTRSPWFNMVRKDNNDFIDIVMKDKNSYTRRQQGPEIFDLTTVAYVCRPDFIKKSSGIFNGRVKGVNIPPERSLDIDTELDFEIAKFLMNKKLSTKKNKENA
jgi:CMP-N-acetylneuraminic acid synthetase